MGALLRNRRGAVVFFGLAALAPVVVRTHYYPAWCAFEGERRVELYATDGQLSFRAPRGGTYTVRLEYPRYRPLTIVALAAFLAGLWVVSFVLVSPARPK